MERKDFIQALFTATILFGITTLLYLYIAGYRLEKKTSTIDFKQTGMLGVKSLPEGSKVYLDGELLTATNDTIAGLNPGKHVLQMIKNGFVTWEKEIEIFPELVTDITAVLVSQTPRLEPLTNTGANFPVISPTLSKLAYFAKGEKSGIWVTSLTGSGLSLFRSDSQIALEDTATKIYSSGQEIEWSYDETQLLVKDLEGKYDLIDLSKGTAQTTASPELTLNEWETKRIKKITDFLEKIEVPENLKAIAVDKKTMWAPDENKFLYTIETDTEIEYKVYNMEKPIPVGEQVETTVFKLPKTQAQPKISWYSDSFHLVLTYFDKENKKGSIYLVRIDGSNQTEVYNNTLHSDKVFSSPTGDKLIILTSFKSGGQTDLYTVGIR